MEHRSGIRLYIADNGIIKEVFDHNVNGTGEEDDYTIVYEFKGKEDKEQAIDFLYEISNDLNLPMGNKYDEQVITIGLAPGNDYMPDADYLNVKIKELEDELQVLKTLRDAQDNS